MYATFIAASEHLLPLTPAVFHILLALAGGECHGYAIMRDVDEQTDGSLQLGPGTLYGCLKRMLAAGLVEESDERPDKSLMTRDDGISASPAWVIRDNESARESLRVTRRL